MDLVLAARNVMKYYRELSKLIAEQVDGHVHSPRKMKNFIRKWSGIEQDYQAMIKMVCTIYRENHFLMTSGEVLAEMPNELDIFANPAFLGRKEMEVVKYIGLNPDELNIYFEYSYLPNKKLVANSLAARMYPPPPMGNFSMIRA